MQVSKDTPNKLATLTKPLEPVAKCVPTKQLKEKVSAPRTHAMALELVEDLGPAQALWRFRIRLKFI